MMKDKRTEPPGRVRFVLGAAVFLLLSGAAFWAIAAFVGDGMPRFDPRLVAPGSLALIALFLLVYFLADGLRLYFVLRALDALQATYGNPIATPANWEHGQDVIVALSLDDDAAKAKFGEIEIRLPYLRTTRMPE